MSALTISYWDENGTPLFPHVECPQCGETNEVGSHFNAVWCCLCGWKGELIEMRELAAAKVIAAQEGKSYYRSPCWPYYKAFGKEK